jgi:hypothetical protein
MRYSVIDGNGAWVEGLSFSSKPKAEAWILSEIEKRGLDYRIGAMVQFRDGTRIEVVHSKTGEEVEWYNVAPSENN